MTRLSRGVPLTVGLFAALIPGILGICSDPSPAFPLPKLDKNSVVLKEAFDNITASLNTINAKPEFNTSSFSIEVTTSEETLWTLYHTAINKDPARPGTEEVDGNSAYRIASISKAFTTLAIIQQHTAGNLSIDDTVDKYIAEFQQPQKGIIPWKNITLRTLASQLSGIPREFAQSDLINELSNPAAFGLPNVATESLLSCDEYSDNYETPCTRDDLINNLQQRPPLYAPKQKSTYSNLNFELLGLVLENVTGLDYATYLEQFILGPLGMTNSSISKPKDDVAVLPKMDNYWDVDEGVQNPTGGIYSTSIDLSKFIRYILTHYNGLSPQFNWFHPHSFSTTVNSFYGMPWEMYRTDKILQHTRRPVTFVTKSGGLPGYASIIIMIPDYDLGLTILVGGAASLKTEIQEAIASPLLNAAESIAQSDLRIKYAGTYTASSLNSSIHLSHSPTKGLHLTTFISNGTNVLETLTSVFSSRTQNDPYRLQLIPTLLYQDEINKKGEIFRIIVVPEKTNPQTTFDAFCITDEDPYMYAGKPLMEVVFWNLDEGDLRHYQEVQLTGFRVKLFWDGDHEEEEEKEEIKKMENNIVGKLGKWKQIVLDSLR